MKNTVKKRFNGTLRGSAGLRPASQPGLQHLTAAALSTQSASEKAKKWSQNRAVLAMKKNMKKHGH